MPMFFWEISKNSQAESNIAYTHSTGSTKGFTASLGPRLIGSLTILPLFPLFTIIASTQNPTSTSNSLECLFPDFRCRPIKIHYHRPANPRRRPSSSTQAVKEGSSLGESHR